jgi:hypothetical protein
MKTKRLPPNYSFQKMAEQDLIEDLNDLKLYVYSFPFFCIITKKIKLKFQN